MSDEWEYQRKVTSSFKGWSPVIWLCLSAIACVALMFIALSIGSANRDSQRTVITVYCASAAVEPFSKIVDQFNSSDRARADRVIADIVRVGGSGALAGQLSTEALTGVQNMGDIFVSADSNRMLNLVNKKVIAESFSVATQFPVIAIRYSKNPDLLQVTDLPSLLDVKIRLGVGSDNSAIGFETCRIAKSNHCRDLLQARKTADFENVMSLAQALSIGSIDAAVLWDSTVHQFNQTDNRPIKILTYLYSDTVNPQAASQNLEDNNSPSEPNFSPTEPDDEYSRYKLTNSKRPGCLIEVGRSISDNQQADLFFSFLKSNRDKVFSDFVDAGFSDLPKESSPDNGRESNQQ